MSQQQTQTYYATSAFSDPANISNLILFVLAILTMDEFREIVPPDALKYIVLATAVLNVAIRTFFSVRPVAAISPGNNKAVQVKSLQEPSDA